MDARRESEPTPMKNGTTVERKSERELVTTRTFNGPARIVDEAWTKPELFTRWWVPKSMGMSLRSGEMDVRVGGKYRLEFEPDAMAIFGPYLEVTPHFPHDVRCGNRRRADLASIVLITAIMSCAPKPLAAVSPYNSRHASISGQAVRACAAAAVMSCVLFSASAIAAWGVKSLAIRDASLSRETVLAIGPASSTAWRRSRSRPQRSTKCTASVRPVTITKRNRFTANFISRALPAGPQYTASRHISVNRGRTASATAWSPASIATN